MRIGFIFIFLTILFTIYGQLIIKYEITTLGAMPMQIELFIPYLLKAFTNLKIVSGVFSAVLAMICWFGAISRLDLSFAYPFMSLSFPAVVFLSISLFHEPFYWGKLLGTILILFGLMAISLK